MFAESVSQDREAILDRYNLIRKDPLEFLKIVRTLDEVDRKSPIKYFPVDLDYIRYYVRVWEKYPKILIPKSRRMKMSWTNIALYLWDTMFNVGRNQAFVSKKEDDSDELVERAKFILDNLDHSEIPKELFPPYEKTYNYLCFPDLNSKIQGFPSGADQLRQFTFSGILGDEMAFWDNAQQMYSSSVPTLEGGGRFTGISTRSPGFFKRLVYDKLDEGFDDKDGDVKPAQAKFPMEGVEIWINPKNGFLVFELDLDADPAKRSPEYKLALRRTMPIRDYLREYGKNWESYEGLPVYADWDRSIHGVKGEIMPHLGLPLLLGLDFGLTPAAVVAQMQGDTLCVLREFTSVNMGAERFLAWIAPQIRILYPQWSDLSKDFIVFHDPSGDFRKDTDETTCTQKVIEAGFETVIPGAITFEERRQSVDHFLTRRTKDGPCFQISLTNCPVLVNGFSGGYRYPDRVLEKEPNKLRPIKDKHSHPHDGLQYICTKITMMSHPGFDLPIPSPSYTLSHPR